MIRDFLDGVFSYSNALNFISKYNLWSYFFLAGIVSLILGLGVAAVTYFFSDNLGDFVFSWYKWEIGSNLVEKLAPWIGGVLIVLLGLLVYKYLVLIIVAPLMGPLSEKVESILENSYEEPAFSLKRVTREAIRGLRINLRNIIREIFLTVLILILGLFPLFTLFSAPAIFILQAYYAGFGNMDYFLERHCGIRESVQFVRSHKGLAVGNGTVFLLLLMIPVAGLFFAPALATVSATIESHKRY